MKRATMTRAPVFRRLVLDGWRGMIGWLVGIAAALLLYLPLYPAMASEQLTQLLDSMPSQLIDALGYDNITSGPGYTQATFYDLIGFVLIVIAATSWGASAIAGMEETGRLELTLAHAVGRISYVIQSIAAVVVKILLLGGFTYLVVWLLNEPSELALEVVPLLAVTIAWMSLGLLSGAAALAVGAATGRRVWAMGAGAGIAVIGYVFEAVAKTSDRLDWLGHISPFAWAFGNDPLANGFDWGGLGLLWAVCIILLGMTIWALSRRDILG